MRIENIRTLRFRGLLLVPAIITLIFTGCATSRSSKADFSDVMGKIVKGETIKDEVQEILGKPQGIYKNSDGLETWTYSKSDVMEKMAQKQAVSTAGTVAGAGLSMFIPFAGPAISYATMRNMNNLEGTTETVMISFDSAGIVSDITMSSYTL